jgi:hypothetical protein
MVIIVVDFFQIPDVDLLPGKTKEGDSITMFQCNALFVVAASTWMLLLRSEVVSAAGNFTNKTVYGSTDLAEERRNNIAALVGLLLALCSLVAYGVFLERKYPPHHAPGGRQPTELQEAKDPRYRKEIPQYKDSAQYLSEVRNAE